MSRVDTWMPLYIGDYLADTRRLTTTEHGAYLLLLMEQWRRGWLPDDDVQLARITGLRLEQWRKAAGTLRCYFGAGEIPGTMKQKRLEAERVKAITIAEKRAESAASRWAKSDTRGDHGSDAKPLETQGAGDANAEQVQAVCITQSQSHLQKEKKEISPPSEAHPNAPLLGAPAVKKTTGKAKALSPDAAFDIFWAKYPRKESKGAARKAWPKAVKIAGSAQEILDGLTVALSMGNFDMREGGRFCPHPSTWLNGERWLDGMEPEPDPDAGTPPQPPLFSCMRH